MWSRTSPRLHAGTRIRLLDVQVLLCPESSGTALFRTVLDTAEGAGHVTRALDLHAEGFDPVMSYDERRTCGDEACVDPVLGRHIARLRWAKGIVFVYPTWPHS